MQNHFYVGVGASAGGLEALESFFKAMPPNTGMSFIVIQHLSPDYKSLMDELLARYTIMDIHVVTEDMEALPNHIYLIPPRKNLVIRKGVLSLEEQKPQDFLKLPIDIFFRSLAKDQEKKSIGIILSGTGSDGTLGVRAIKEAGGMIMVQDEESARFDGMPRSSISTGLVDYILKPEQMPGELINYIAHPAIPDGLLRKAIILDSGLDDMSRISIILRNYCGVDFSSYKENTVLRRLDRRVKVNKCINLKEYITILQGDDREKETLLRELLIGVTAFFRDAEAFESLEQNVLPNLDYSKGYIRIWSCGCSTGEEVYSLAILISEYMHQRGIQCSVKLFATDIDGRALEMAGAGYYIDSLVSDLTKDYLHRYFTKRSEGYVVSEAIRKMVVFAKHNILKDPPFSKLDLLVCRNLFIYLRPENQQHILTNFYYAIFPKGYLMMGSSESVGDLHSAFTTIDSKWKIYQSRDGFKPDLATSSSHANGISYGRSSGGDNLLIDATSATALSKTIGGSGTHLIGSSSTHVHAQNMIPPLDSHQYAQPLRIENLLMEALTTVLPPSIIVDKADGIVQVIGRVTPYIHSQPGRFSNNINSNTSRELGLYINNVLRRLKNGTAEIILKNMIHQDNQVVSLHGRILNTSRGEFYLITFIEGPLQESPSSSATPEDSTPSVAPLIDEIDFKMDINERMHHLEIELQMARESHQATIEELETANEELQSSNEELIASNEELQSTNEELQSVNEELYTVNSEFQSKIDELTKMTNDLNNLIRNTEIGALYLDSKLHIRKLTPVVSKVTHILEGDVGRPIQHIAVMQSYPTLIDDINSVLDDLQGIEKEIVDEQNRTWLTRIRPYRTAYYAVDGIIVTFVDISDLKTEQRRLAQNVERLDRALKLGSMAWWEYNLEDGSVKYSDGKATMIGYTPDEFPKSVYAICDLIHPEDYEATMQAMRDYLEGRTTSWNVTYRIRTKKGDYAKYHDLGFISERKANGVPTRLVGTVMLL